MVKFIGLFSSFLSIIVGFVPGKTFASTKNRVQTATKACSTGSTCAKRQDS